MAKYPARLRVGAEQHALFAHRSDLYAVRTRPGHNATGAVAVVPDDAQTSFAVYAGTPASESIAGGVTPVYSAGPDGPLAIPTGRVFIRLTDGVRPEQRQPQFAAAGFEIERTLSYAPHAAWLRSRDGGVEGALRGLDALKNVPDVIHVEPQMLLERAMKR